MDTAKIAVYTLVALLSETSYRLQTDPTSDKFMASNFLERVETEGVEIVKGFWLTRGYLDGGMQNSAELLALASTAILFFDTLVKSRLVQCGKASVSSL